MTNCQGFPECSVACFCDDQPDVAVDSCEVCCATAALVANPWPGHEGNHLCVECRDDVSADGAVAA